MQSVTRPPRPNRCAAFSALLWCAVAALGLPLEAAFAQASGAAQRHDRVLVRFKPGATDAARSQARAAARTDRELVFTLVPGLERLYVRPGLTATEVLLILRRDPNVVYAEHDFVTSKAATPNDPVFSRQWNMQRIRAQEAWNRGTGDANLPVAILDTGIDRSHPDLRDNLWQNAAESVNGRDDDGNGLVDDIHGWDFAYGDNDPSDIEGHGTRVAGVVGARGNNGAGVTGINWRVKLVALKVLDDRGNGFVSNAIQALQYAHRARIRVSNASWGTSGYSQALHDAIEAMKSINHLVVAAAGNGGSDGVGDNNDSAPVYPASFTHDNLIAVAAATWSDTRAPFSNFGRNSVDLAAPGLNIWSTAPGGQYPELNGTSMAAPHVAGAAVLVWSLRPDWTYSQVREALLRTTQPLPSFSGLSVTGGLLNLNAALAYVSPAPTPPAPAPAPLPATPTPPVVSHVLSLRWIDASADEWGFRVERSVNGGPFSLYASVGANGSSYVVTGLEPGKTYGFRVLAYNGAGESSPTDAVTVRFPGVNEAPLTPTKLPPSTSRATANLSWTNVVGETGFQIGRAVYNSSRRSCDALVGIRTVAANVTSADDTVSAGGTFCYAVRAYNGAAYSVWSNSVVITIPR
jgi:subtilisin family serine protease